MMIPEKELLNNGKIDSYAIRLKKGAKIIQSLEDFVRKYEKEIGFAEFSMIGSVEKVEVFFSLGYGKGEKGYRPVSLPTSDKSVIEKTSLEQMELLPSWGNITWDYHNPNNPIVHCHISLANYEHLQVFGGHLKEATVALTVEMILKVLSKEKLFKKSEENTKLHLWNFEKIKNQIITDDKNMLVVKLKSSQEK